MNFLPLDRFSVLTESSLLKVTAVLLPSAGWMLSGGEAIAQSAVTLDPNTGQVEVDRNAIDLRTGPLENTSNIPLPTVLPQSTRPRFSQPVDTNRRAPNSIEITPDADYIEQSVERQLQQSDAADGYTLDESTIRLTTEFEFERERGTHGYGEGIETSVVDAAGAVQSPPESAFIRGDRIKFGPDGQALPDENQLRVTYGVDDTVRVRFLNLRRNGKPARESGVYFTESGEIIVEDLQNGGDRDFDDGDYLTTIDGEGEAAATRTSSETTQRTEIEETQLAPERREEPILGLEADAEDGVLQAPDPAANTTANPDEVQADAIIEETTDWGEIEIPQTLNAQIGHGSGAQTEAGEQLVYNLYSRPTGQVRAGSNGIALSGQLSPISRNPERPPTFATGSITFDPSAGDNEAGLVGTARLTHFLTRTHRAATDMFGSQIISPVTDANAASPLLEPAGWGDNRRLVGYVPSTTSASTKGSTLTSQDGIFQIPADQAVEIAPSDPQSVGQGNAAYRNNVGGLLIEKADGSLSFMPQWTEREFHRESMTLAAGEATRIIYALVPQQLGQSLQIGEMYNVDRTDSGYQISEGQFTVIAANQHPQNFNREQAEVYAVEDTLPGINPATEDFNGLRGLYSHTPGGELHSTVDLRDATNVDARVGNQLFALPDNASSGQRAYYKTTRAGGFYLGGALSLGLGNQRDTVTRTTVLGGVSESPAIRGIRIFETPLTQIDERRIETIETIQNLGMTFFNINNDGEIENVRFVPGEVINREQTSRQLSAETRIERGEESLIDTIFFDADESAIADDVESDESEDAETNTYPNISPLQGELAMGMVYNFGNTPWSAAANTVRAEIFTRGLAFGQRSNIRAGWRSEVVFHPFGEVQRQAFQYDEAGDAVPVYQTAPVLKADGSPLTERITTNDGGAMEVAVNQFVTNEEGARFTQSVGTGRSKGPGVYLRLEDILDDEDSLNIAAGFQFTF